MYPRGYFSLATVASSWKVKVLRLRDVGPADRLLCRPTLTRRGESTASGSWAPLGLGDRSAAGHHVVPRSQLEDDSLSSKTEACTFRVHFEAFSLGRPIYESPINNICYFYPVF